MSNSDDKTQLVDTNAGQKPQFAGGPSLDLYDANNQNAHAGNPQNNGAFFNLKVSDLPNAKAVSTQWTRIPETLGLGRLKLNMANFGNKLKFIRSDEAPTQSGRNIQAFVRILKIIVVSAFAIMCSYMIFQRFFGENHTNFLSEESGLDFEAGDGIPGSISNSQPANDSHSAPSEIESFIGEVLSFIGFNSEQAPVGVPQLHSPSVAPPAANTDTINKLEKQPDKIAANGNLTDRSKYSETIGGEMFPNPYWYLPNKTTRTGQGFSRSLSVFEVEELRKALHHPFFYQRHKLIDGIISNRLGNSEIILREAASGAPRLWLRMNAVMGLAHLGYPVVLEDVERALGSDPTYRISNYFKRFQDRGGPAEQYIMRYAIKIVGDGARRSILQALSRDLSYDNDLYLAASEFDPGSKTKKWLKKSQSLKLIPEEARENLRQKVIQLASENTSDIGGSIGSDGKPKKAIIEESLELIDEPIN